MCVRQIESVCVFTSACVRDRQCMSLPLRMCVCERGREKACEEGVFLSVCARVCVREGEGVRQGVCV